MKLLHRIDLLLYKLEETFGPPFVFIPLLALLVCAITTLYAVITYLSIYPL